MKNNNMESNTPMRRIANTAVVFAVGIFTLILSADNSFTKDYKLSGSSTDQVKQIGNSIPVQTAKAIVKAIFSKEPK